MNQQHQVFERIEQKYLISPDQRVALKTILGTRMQADQYGLQTVANIYYDDPDYSLIRYSLDKPIYKEKLRLRSYGRAQWEDHVYVELKKKLRGVVYKRRVIMPLKAAERFLNTGKIDGTMNQIQREIYNFCCRRLILPAAFVAYEREAWLDPADSGLRVTMDYNIRCRATNLSLSQPLEGVELLSVGQILMELKARRAMPHWMARTLSQLRIYPISFSKVGVYYRDYLLGGLQLQGGAGHVA